jgi:signal transduction histidine kinase/ligand-binding sensor domain-containing protein
MTDNRQAVFCKTFGLLSFLPIIMLLVMSYVPVCAQQLSSRRDNYVSTHFSAGSGLNSTLVDDIVQSDDGFLWLRVSGEQLARFDGQHFQVSGELIDVSSLAVEPNGDLWVGSGYDLKQIRAGDLNQFTYSPSASYHLEPGMRAIVLHFSRKGVLWLGTNRGLYRFDQGRLVPAIPGAYVERIEEAANGHLWITAREAPMEEWDGMQAIPHPELTSQLGVKLGDIFHVLEDSHGVTWFCTANGVARRVGSTIEKLSPWGPGGHQAFRAYEDPLGRLWFARSEGLFQLTPAGLEPVASGMQVRRMHGDRDGNLWVGTNGDGLYRFRDTAERTFTTADGLPNNVAMTVLTAYDGSLWTGFNCGGISRFDGHSFRTYNEKDGLLNSCVWSLAEDAKHDLWIGTWGGGLFRFHNGTFTQYSKPQGLSGDVVLSVVAASDGSVWFTCGGGVSRIRNGQVRNFSSADGLSYTSYWKVYEDRSGGVWVASTEGTEHLVGDRFQRFLIPGTFRALLVGEDLDGALYFFDKAPGALQRNFRVLNGQPIEIAAVSGALGVRQVKQGDLWFFSNWYTRRFPAGQLYRQGEPVDYETFGSQDGIPEGGLSDGDHISALTPDGKLWIATTEGLVSLDLPRLSRTLSKPAIYVEKMTVGRTAQTPSHELILPAGTHHLELDFDAIDITSPEKIRLQYRMDGIDSEWLDARPPGHAVYNALPPGRHAFHMRAANRSGIWDRTGTIYYVTQQPYFYQTTWFLAASVAIGLLLIAVLYQVRVRQVVTRANERFELSFDERLAERMRIARDLHDTFLQTIQGSKLVADSALKQSADPLRMRSALEQLSVWLERATEEGRAALNSLRTSTTEANDLAEAFRRAIEECRIENSMEASFSVAGDAREMHPIVRDEVYRIGYEAIRNACVHSQASKLQVTLTYAEELGVRVSDNGVGIDPLVADHGKEGHFGLQGMRERAARIAGKLTVTGSPASGTVVKLVVPGKIIYLKTVSIHMDTR